MGKAAERRKNSRQEYLKKLATTDPKLFEREWAKRLQSWGHTARKFGNVLIDEQGKPTPSPSVVVRDAMRELAACGKRTVKREGQDTRDTLNSECVKGVAAAVGEPMYGLDRHHTRRR